jgi:hypothetical protein
MRSGGKSRRGGGRGEGWLTKRDKLDGQGAPFCRILRLKNYGVLENRERDRLEPKSQENRRRMDMLVCGYGFVCPVGGRSVVGARDELLHRW